MDVEELTSRAADNLRASAAGRPLLEEATRDSIAIIEALTAGARVPERIKALAVVETSCELYLRRGTRSGIAQFGDVEPQVIRVSRDPAEAAKAILRPWLGHPIA